MGDRPRGLGRGVKSTEDRGVETLSQAIPVVFGGLRSGVASFTGPHRL